MLKTNGEDSELKQLYTQMVELETSSVNTQHGGLDP